MKAVATAAAFLFLIMQFAKKHLDTAEKIIDSYDGSMPLHHYLKQFFAADKKYGSKDRKAITHACYCYYRLGHSLKRLKVNDKIKAGIFLCTDEPGTWISAFNEEWISAWEKDLNYRVDFLRSRFSFNADKIFPFRDQLSHDIDIASFQLSHLIQPDLHLRIRPGKEKKVVEQLNKAGITYEGCGNSCISVSNATKIDQLLPLNKDVVVQDMSSQRIGKLLSTINHRPSTIKLWDCCAASGGKSILAVDVLKKVKLTVSDVRFSIIQNLKKRFAEAGISNYYSFIADLTDASTQISPEKFDLVICDAPCSGSGTWSRNPEQLFFFDEKKIAHYTTLQKKIIKTVIPSIKNGGYFLYITCSVFKEENEEMVKYILEDSVFELQKMEVLRGYDKKADTMFAALFKNSKF